MLLEAKVKYNGNHYFAGQTVRGSKFKKKYISRQDTDLSPCPPVPLCHLWKILSTEHTEHTKKSVILSEK